jgi:hypothetical protein
MKYMIEIVSPVAFGEDPLSRAIVHCSLAAAQRKAMPLLEIWAAAGATHARVLDLEGQLAAEVFLEHARAA